MNSSIARTGRAVVHRCRRLLAAARNALTPGSVETPQNSVTRPSSAEEQRDAAQEASAAKMSSALAKREARHAQALALGSSQGRTDWPPQYSNPKPQISGSVPEIDAQQFNADILGGAVQHHGALLIRGLFTAEQVADVRQLQDVVKRESQKEWPFLSPWYQPFEGNSRFEWELRHRTQNNGGNWLADSPLGMERVLGHLHSVGVIDAIASHLGEQPAISLQKSTLRSVAPVKDNAGWHQDGSFLGDDVRTMNIWVALSPCGGSRPASGLEIIPTRFDKIFAVDPELGRASLPTELVDALIGEYTSVVPEFMPGDALMFDEKLLHRTAVGPHLCEVRYALESWFFAPSHTAPTYVPFLASEGC